MNNWGYLTALCVIAIPVLAIFTKGKWKKTNWAGRLSLIVGVILAICGTVLSCKQSNKQKLIERITAKVGNFSDIFGAQIPSLTVGPSNDNPFLWNPMISNWFEGNLLGPLFRLYVIDKKLYVDIVIRNNDGNAIAAIEKNEWTLLSENYEYNNDDTGFELVTKGDRKVYFQVYLDHGIAHILGFVFRNDGWGMKFIPSEKDRKVSFSTVMLSPDTKKDKKELLEGLEGAIFKYPRQTHIGERKSN